MEVDAWLARCWLAIAIETQSQYDSGMHSIVKARTGMSPEKPDSLDPRPQEPTTIAFEQIANGLAEVLITFEGQVYRLRRTKNDRLILTK